MSKNTICPLPWTGISMNPHGRIRACGRSKPNVNAPSLKSSTIEESWNSDYYSKLRLDMLAGVKNSNCENCYKQEQLGGTSKRQELLERYAVSEDQLIKSTDVYGHVTNMPEIIDIRVGNVCNLKCVHCWTGNSSKWYEDKNLLDKYENTTKYAIDNSWIDSSSHVWQYLRDNIKNITTVNVLGGEPFASKQHNQFIDWCIATDNTHIELHYVTNATLLTPEMVVKLSKFRALDLGISIDDIGSRSELLRFPNKWADIDNILTYINGLNLQQVFFNWTCYNLNIRRLGYTIDYCRTHFPNIAFKLSDYVTSPAHMSAQNLPPEYKDRVARELVGYPEAQFYVNFMFEDNLWEEYHKVLFNYLEDLDRARKTDWKKVLPEIAELYKDLND